MTINTLSDAPWLLATQVCKCQVESGALVYYGPAVIFCPRAALQLSEPTTGRQECPQLCITIGVSGITIALNSQRPCIAEVNSLSDSDEECLRPSLLRKRHQTSSQSNTPHRENIPWKCQSMTPDHKASHAAATAYDSPAHQTPFTALFSSCPSTGVESKAGVSPAEHNLFGNPTSSPVLRAFSAIPGASGYASASVQHQENSSHSMSKLVTHISNLKKQHAQVAQHLKVGATVSLHQPASRCTLLHGK